MADPGSGSASDSTASPVFLGNLLQQSGCTVASHLLFLALLSAWRCFEHPRRSSLPEVLLQVVPSICTVVLDGIKCFEELVIIWFLRIC